MRWTIRLELTPDGNPPITYEIGTVTRAIADLSPEEIGLTLEEGQQLLRQLQVQIIASQAHAYALCRRPCVHCGKPKPIKDVRTKCVQTVFGAFRFRGRLIRPADVAPTLTGTARSSRWVKSSRGEQLRRCVICWRSWALGCRTVQRRRYLKCAVSAI
jgi:hypothetical protein